MVGTDRALILNAASGDVQQASWHTARCMSANGTHCDNMLFMKPIAWNADKNAWLKAERNITFEDVVFHMMAGDIVDTVDHPNQARYRVSRST